MLRLDQLYKVGKRDMRYQRRLARIVSRMLIVAQILTLSINAGFTPETLVYTSETCKPIADVVPEEYVISYGPTNQLEPHQVTHVTSYQVHDLIEIICSNTTLYTDAYQLLFLPEHNAWRQAGYLSVGDALWHSDGTYTYVEHIQRISGTYTVYSISVSDAHTFYATRQAILVHNSPEGGVVSAAVGAAGSLATGAESAAFVINPFAAAGFLFITFLGYVAYSRSQERARRENNAYERLYYPQPRTEATAAGYHENPRSGIAEEPLPAITNNEAHQEKTIDEVSHEDTSLEKYLEERKESSTWDNDTENCQELQLIYADDGKLHVARKKKNSDAQKKTFQSIKMAASGGAGDPNDPRNRNNWRNNSSNNEKNKYNKREKILPKEKSYERARLSR